MNLLKHLISTRTTAVLLFLFAAAIGTATFIENSYDTITARVLIYNSFWFEAIVVLLVINFSYNIKRYGLFSKRKISILLIHLGFIVVILGAGITRYIGFEGVMIIQEGESINYIYSSEPYLQVYATDSVKQYTGSKQLYFTPVTSNAFDFEIDFHDKKQINISYLDYVYNAEKVISPSTESGKKILELTLPGRQVAYIKEGEVFQQGKLVISFNNDTRIDAVKFYDNEKGRYAVAPYPYDMLRANMADLTKQDRVDPSKILWDTLIRGSENSIKTGDLINFRGVQIAVNLFHKNAHIKYISSDNQNLPDALIVKLSVGGVSSESVLLGGAGHMPVPTTALLNGMYFQLGYGAKKIELPFEITLSDFRLLKYPGSESPSSFESDIVINDNINNLNKKHHLFMNNVVDYGGYRFFQSSYDWSSDELKNSGADPDKTILSVNHDFWGTWTTYFGYFLLIVGFMGSLLNKNSRFLKVRKQVIKIRKQRFTGWMILPFLFLSSFQAQEYHPVDLHHAEKFGHLLVQSAEGRIEPIHTLAYDLFHKVSKKDQFELEDGTQLDAMQVFMDYIIDPEFWVKQNVIYVKPGTGVADDLGITGKYASLDDFYDENNNEKLFEKHRQSKQKKDIEKSVFDKELIKVYERFNILNQLRYVTILKIFPIENDPNNKWVDLSHDLAHKEIGGDKHGLTDVTLFMILVDYFRDVYSAKETGEYKPANVMLDILSTYQLAKADKSILPSPSLIDLEIYYNKTNIFGMLKNVYGLLAVLLLIFSFIDALISNRGSLFFKICNIVLWALISALALAFVYHSYGLGLRWYITGHEPWSNGYEALTFIAWGGLLAGFVFVRNSKITLAATSLLAFFVLMTAGHSSFDPQLTNLQPVLKSYWLMIHVASITISYGFLGLGFILGMINLFTYLLKTRTNQKRLNGVITELTFINEMTLTIGLVLATVGMFLGGIWANESWGRYWGWDAKETWALVIVIVYAIILHFRLIPGLRGRYVFNVASIIGFSSVLMTFFGVNYYLSKGLHSYARGDTPVFPMWAWYTIGFVFLLIIGAGLKEKIMSKKQLNKT